MQTQLNVADQVKAIMNPHNPHAARRGDQLDLIDEQNWAEYYERRYGSYGASVRSAYDEMDELYRRDKKRDSWDKPGKGVTVYGPKSTQVTGYKPQPSNKVYVQHKDGSLQSFTVPYDCTGWFDIAKTAYPTKQDKDIEAMVIPIDRCEFTYGEPTFNACVYSATQDYIQARWGRKLDDSDRRWLARHPLATDSGIPQEYTVTAIQQLVAPYGMKVSKVRIRAGALVLGDQVMQWAQALGCNPMALADRKTSNAQAAELMGMDLSMADQLWRLEFSDVPLPGSIVGERGWSSGAGVQVGSFGGHARYLAPRASAGDWFVSVQLAPISEVEYLCAAPDPEYVERKGAPTLQLAKIVDANGELIAVRDGNKWRAWQDIKAGVPSTPDPVPVPVVQQAATPPVSKQPVPFTHAFTCELCEKPCEEIDRCYERTNIDVCIDCAVDAWDGIQCPECQHEPRWFEIPYPLAMTGESFEYQCQSCKGEFTVPYDTTERHLIPLVEYSYGAFDLMYTADDPMDLTDRDTPPGVADEQADGSLLWRDEAWD